MTETNEPKYIVKITAGLINSIFCNEMGDVVAILTSGDLHQVFPMFREWMRFAIRHPDGTHMTTEEADAIFDDMPPEEYFGYIKDISEKAGLAIMSTGVYSSAEDTTEPQESA